MISLVPNHTEQQWQRLRTARRIFITATDTEVGKTHTSALLLNALAAEGRRMAYLKPAETGCESTTGRLQSAEIATILRMAHGAVGNRAACPYRYEKPLAPYTAAMHSGALIELARLDRTLAELEAEADCVVIEGAGGLMVPVTTNHTWLDLIVHWQAEPVVVIGNKLGCVSHTTLTERVLRQAGYLRTAYVLNDCTDSHSAATQSNRWTLEATLGYSLLAHLRYGQMTLDIPPDTRDE